MKTHFRKIKDPNWLGSWDLMKEDGSYGKIVLTIKEAKTSEVVDHKGKANSEATLHFNEAKPMILNHTNVRAVAKACGSPYIEDWTGKKVTIYVTQVKAFGEMHDALRVESIPVKEKPKKDFTPDLFGKALEKKASIESIKKHYTVTAENEAEYVKQLDAIVKLENIGNDGAAK